MVSTNSMLSARQSSGLLAGVSSRESQRHEPRARMPSRLGGTRKIPTGAPASGCILPRLSGQSARGCPKPKKGLRVTCLQLSESSGVRSPSYTASEAIKMSRCRFKEELSNQDEDIDLAKAALLIASEDQASEVWNFCKKMSAALKEGREPPKLPNTFAAAKRDVNIAIGGDGPLQLRVGGHTVDYWLGFLAGLAREVETRFTHMYGEDSARSPLRLITLVNEILFSEFGFNGKIRAGDLRNSYLHLTLQTGRGTATMLSIIYIEVLKRVGISMVGAPVSSEYFLCWPKIEGVQIAFDPYHSGQGYLRNDIEHMFRKMIPNGSTLPPAPFLSIPTSYPPEATSPRSGATSPRSVPTSPRSGPTSPRLGATDVEEVVEEALEVAEEEMVEEMYLRPASNRQIVASLLRTLRNISLQQATRALKTFSLVGPLSRPEEFNYALAPAAMQGVLDRDRMRHCISVSERLLMVTPDDPVMKRDHGLLLYHNKQFRQALTELGAYIKADISEADRDAARTLIHRIRLITLEETDESDC